MSPLRTPIPYRAPTDDPRCGFLALLAGGALAFRNDRSGNFGDANGRGVRCKYRLWLNLRSEAFEDGLLQGERFGNRLARSRNHEV
jgi:hypothetical protein